ncbi:MAG: 2-alkenal reductase [Candidatus Chloroheliales bacterium]|nr:MAG: 2-alkenal reductase [Chloroflexota bacterium]
MSKYRLVLAVMFLSLLIGSIAGGIAGGAAAGYFSTRAGNPTAAVALTSATSSGTLTNTTQPTTSNQAATGSGSAASAAQTLGPAVVTVINHLSRGQGEAQGSGIIIDKSGHIVTNAHVVSGEQSLEVVFANSTTRVSAKLIGADSYDDIAVIQVSAPVPAVASFGNSDALVPGEPVIAIGSALGEYRNTVTAGVVSATGRHLDGEGSALIQTDAAINHGNSGGPLADLSGKVIGINVAVVTSSGSGFTSDIAQGLGFSIPSNDANKVAQQLIQTGAVIRPYIGISYLPIDDQVAAYYNLSVTSGVLVQQVPPGSPADKAGLQAGDIITKLDNQAVGTDNPLASVLMTHKVGDTISVTYIRGGQTSTVKVTLIERPNGQ